MTSTTLSPIRLDDLVGGDRITIIDSKKQELTGTVLKLPANLKAPARMAIKAFGAEVAFAVWRIDHVDPNLGKWESKFKIIDYVLAIPGL